MAQSAYSLLFAKPQYVITLILRYLNIFYLVGIPLFFAADNKILETLPLVGLGGLSFLILGSLFPKFRSLLVRHYYVSSLTLLLVITVGSLSVGSERSYYIFTMIAFVLGFSTANCEIRSVFTSVQDVEFEEKAINLQTYNSLKVLGIAIGFFSAALLSGKNSDLLDVYIPIGFTVLLLCLLLYFSLLERNRSSKTSFSLKRVGFTSLSPYKIMCIFLFILDVSLFTFWYVYLPERLVLKEIVGVQISVLLAVQAFSHAFSQVVWKKIIVKLGAFSTYWLSFVPHLLIVIFIGISNFTFPEGLLLFALMGLLNSGTFIASSLLFYKGKKISLGDSFVHQGASQAGKFIGASICNLYLLG